MHIPKVGIISQARMSSSRLPGKVLKKSNGLTLLHYHLQRLRKSGYPVFIATTKNITDDPIVDFCNNNFVEFSRGDEQNVLERFYECALKYDLSVIVRVTSDCPLIDGEMIADAVDNYLNFKSTNLYYSNCIERTYPRGFDFEIFTFDMLKEAFEKSNTQSEKEHVTPFFYQNKSKEFTLLHYRSSENHSNFRITVDTEEDFELMNLLIEKYNCAEKSGLEIIEILKKNPQLSKLNEHIEQKKA